MFQDHIEAREHFKPIVDEGKKKNCAVVSLGDLGESKAVEPNTKELFAGTSRCFKLAADYLEGYKVPYEVVGGNHDLEGIVIPKLFFLCLLEDRQQNKS